MALEKAEIEPLHHTVSSLAAAEAVLTRQQKEAGTALIDIGAGTTNLIVFEDGEVQHVAVLPLGGQHITNDLAIGLKTDLDIAISNQCGRLISNVVIAYNSIMLSMLLDKQKGNNSEKFLTLLRKISPVAWQHIHFLGHYAFRNNYNPIDLEAMLVDIRLD